MIPDSIEYRFRQFLLVLAGMAFIGSVIELWFIEHYEEFLQIVPFVLCGMGLLFVGIMWYYPTKTVIKALRVVMGFIGVGGLFGIYEHVGHNLAFEMEIKPNAAAGDVFWDALGGASPFLAPGILTFAAVLALAATYKHPALTDSDKHTEP